MPRSCALRAGMDLAVSADMLVEGRHFPADADPGLLGHSDADEIDWLLITGKISNEGGQIQTAPLP